MVTGLQSSESPKMWHVLFFQEWKCKLELIPVRCLLTVEEKCPFLTHVPALITRLAGALESSFLNLPVTASSAESQRPA